MTNEIINGVEVKVTPSGENGCKGCIFENEVCQQHVALKGYLPLHLYCMAKYREDNISVKFTSV